MECVFSGIPKSLCLSVSVYVLLPVDLLKLSLMSLRRAQHPTNAVTMEKVFIGMGLVLPRSSKGRRITDTDISISQGLRTSLLEVCRCCKPNNESVADPETPAVPTYPGIAIYQVLTQFICYLPINLLTMT